jgi:hypothetical protein
MNIPLCAPVTAVQFIRTGFCAHAELAAKTAKKMIANCKYRPLIDSPDLEFHSLDPVIIAR